MLKSTKSAIIAAVLMLAGVPVLHAQLLTLGNPDWEIDLTDAGYSDYLGDLTPGFEGREYLSGEWGAAVGYTLDGDTVSPTWLEPDFIFPDWTTNSDFDVVSFITETGTNADGLPIAESIIANNDLQITQRFEMIDTVTGTPMGIVSQSAGGAGNSIRSNRYVLQQTYTIENISGQTITDLQLFQLLHGLNSQTGVYDDRAYSGPLGAYRYDTTMNGADPDALGASPEGVQDYIALHSSVSPSADELGAFGVGSDDHEFGKPTDGVHLSIENNWVDEPYLSRLGADSYAVGMNDALWIAGAQRWELGSLAPGGAVSADVLLSILTGTKVVGESGPGGSSPASGSCNGGSDNVGGLNYDFEDVILPGSLFTEYSAADEDEIDQHVAEGEYDYPDFTIAGSAMQVWELEFTGEFNGSLELIFAFDATLLGGAGPLGIYHFTDGAWEFLGGTVDLFAGTITVQTDSLSPFALGVVPEPSLMFALLPVGLMWRNRTPASRARGHRV